MQNRVAVHAVLVQLLKTPVTAVVLETLMIFYEDENSTRRVIQYTGESTCNKKLN